VGDEVQDGQDVVDLEGDSPLLPGAGDSSWQLALSLIAAWRGAGDSRGQAAAAQRLAAAADGDAATVEQAVLGLLAVSNMFLELYADCAGMSVDAVLRNAAIIGHDEGPSG
jgi:hypothetical protein